MEKKCVMRFLIIKINKYLISVRERKTERNGRDYFCWQRYIRVHVLYISSLDIALIFKEFYILLYNGSLHTQLELIQKIIAK